MKILNVGALEILFIVLLALIILGPKNAVKALGDVGTWLRKLRDSQIWQDFLTTSKEIRDFPKKMMDEVEIKKTLDEINTSSRLDRADVEKKTRQETDSTKDFDQNIYPGSTDDHP